MPIWVNKVKQSQCGPIMINVSNLGIDDGFLKAKGGKKDGEGNLDGEVKVGIDDGLLREAKRGNDGGEGNLGIGGGLPWDAGCADSQSRCRQSPNSHSATELRA